MSRIPILVICCATLFVIVGEKACGTDTYFVAAVGVIFLAIGITYNLLGGLRAITGILFTAFALRTIVASQFLKIFFREPADLNLEAPHLTITLYLIFYCSVALSSVLLAQLRIRLPRPIEPRTPAQARKLYLISLAGGVIGTFMFLAEELSPVGEQHLTLSHSIGLALSNLIYVAFVLAIDEKIRKSGGRHSVGWALIIPGAVVLATAIVSTKRGNLVGAVLLYAIVCYFRGYRFRRRHLLGGISFVLFFLFVYSPFELYSREFLSSLDFSQRAEKAIQIMEQHPNLGNITSSVENEGGYTEGRVGYLSGTTSNALQRPTLIWEDSTLISVCASGFRYGWTSIKMDFAQYVPRFINPNKPDEGASWYVGRTSGLNPDNYPDAKIAFSPICDSFAGFGIPGVVILGLVIVPVFLAVYRGVFDPSTLWGTVGLAMALPTFGEWRTGQLLLNTFYQPIYLIGFSWILNIIVQLIPGTIPLPAAPPLPLPAQPSTLR